MYCFVVRSRLFEELLRTELSFLNHCNIDFRFRLDGAMERDLVSSTNHLFHDNDILIAIRLHRKVGVSMKQMRNCSLNTG